MKKSTPKKTAPKKTIVKKNTISKSQERRVAAMNEKPTAVVSPFTVSLALAYDTIVGKGATITEALEQFPNDCNFKSKGTITIESEGKKAHIVMQPVEIKRLLSKDLNKVFFEKRMLSIMK